MEVKTYNWWESGDNEPPPHLKTKKQLAEMGLKPIQPVGVIKTRNYDLYLYDSTNLESSAPKKKRELSLSQKAALEKGRNLQKYRAWYKEEGYLIKQWILDKNSSIDWAQSLLNSDDWVILDTETTGLGCEAECVQIGIVNPDGSIVLDSLVKPTIVIPDEVIAIHGISNEMVEDAPAFPEVYHEIVKALQDKKVIIYNADFDIKILKYCCELHSLPLLNIKKRSSCAMTEYSAFCNEWSNYYDDYISQPLNGGHTAISDCLAVLALIKKMASSTKGSFDKYKKEFGL